MTGEPRKPGKATPEQLLTTVQVEPTAATALAAHIVKLPFSYVRNTVFSAMEEKRGRGRPPSEVDTSARLTIQMRPETKAKLESVAALQNRPVWQVIDSALAQYFSLLPRARRAPSAGRTVTAPAEKQWVSLAAFIGSGDFGGSSMSRLSTRQITVAAQRRGVDPDLYLDGTRSGRNRLELAIHHRSEVVEALKRGETVPAVTLAAYPDLAG